MASLPGFAATTKAGESARKARLPTESSKNTPVPLQAATVPADSFVENIIAGSLARGISQTLLHPIDVMRTRLQAEGVNNSFTSIGAVLTIASKGLGPCVLLSVPAGGLQFMTYEYAKEKLNEWVPDNNAFVQVTSGALGALAASVIRVPQEVIKQRIQAGRSPNMFACVKALFQNEGPKGLYTGYLSTVLRDVPYNAAAFLFFEQMKGFFPVVFKRDPENWENLVMGGMAGAVSAVMWTPIDVVKTRLMTQDPRLPPKYVGILDTFAKIHKEGALMKGVTPRVVYLSPMSAISFSVYEAVKGMMRKSKTLKSKDSHSLEDEMEADKSLIKFNGQGRGLKRLSKEIDNNNNNNDSLRDVECAGSA
eukprot:CAMPEP_0184651218 /NCGR_PEP_ID=MMETSP0308-20130426/8801_1 /TAXON_ID=38269 /ORGANISM="Gloeochaete witrockiana, Strain SAG 46.84" /LENGTH=364 /DNA_ID=CAMNT_0027085277 /DNA_START=15 /DNA_END=1110 /DNA_ORIENTATION=+